MFATLLHLFVVALIGAGVPLFEATSPVRVETPAWAVEFDGPAGSRLDSRVWTYDVGNAESDGWGNHELQCYTDESANVSLDGAGHLAIVARVNDDSSLAAWNGSSCGWTSARITTIDTVAFGYGRAEARIKVPTGRGLWPAFWMLGSGEEVWPANGEIDIMEVIGDDVRSAFGTAHMPGHMNSGGLGGEYVSDTDLSDGYHTFAIEKQPETITWFVDGESYFSLDRDDVADASEWIFDRPFYLLLNLAVGGDWPGPPNERTTFPATLSIDYVRLYGDVAVTPRDG